MQKHIEAIYENGVLKPSISLDLKEHEKVEIIIKDKVSIAKMTQGIMKGLNSKLIDEIALSPEYSCMEE